MLYNYICHNRIFSDHKLIRSFILKCWSKRNSMLVSIRFLKNTFSLTFFKTGIYDDLWSNPWAMEAQLPLVNNSTVVVVVNLYYSDKCKWIQRYTIFTLTYTSSLIGLICHFKIWINSHTATHIHVHMYNYNTCKCIHTRCSLHIIL